METLEWMLQESMVPWAIGIVAAATLSKWSEWSARTKIRAAYVYHVGLLIGSFYEAPNPHGSFWEIQLRSGVLAAFGIGVSMAQWRYADSGLARLAPSLFFLLHCSVIWLNFSDRLAKAFRHLPGV